jgi:hypothetical protein
VMTEEGLPAARPAPAEMMTRGGERTCSAGSPSLRSLMVAGELAAASIYACICHPFPYLFFDVLVVILFLWALVVIFYIYIPNPHYHIFLASPAATSPPNILSRPATTGMERGVGTEQGRSGREEARIAAAWKTRPGTGEAQSQPEVAENGPSVGSQRSREKNIVIVLGGDRPTVALLLPLARRCPSSFPMKY